MPRKTRRSSSSGAPGIKNGMGPALNSLSIKGNYLDGTVAAEAWKKKGSEWDKFWRNDKAVAAFSQPVRSRSNGIP